MALIPAIFLEKDGMLLADIPYNVDPRRMRFARGSAAGLSRLASLGLPLIVVSNQPGIALGKFMPEAMSAVHDELSGMFRQAGAMLSGFYYCPHHPRGVRPGYSKSCECRKPAPGLLHIAAQRQYLDLSHSWFVGDTLDDVEAGRRAGCKTLLVNTGGETEWRRNEWRSPDATASDLHEASQWISDRTVALGGPRRRPSHRVWRPSAMHGLTRYHAISGDDVPNLQQQDKKKDKQHGPGRRPGHSPDERDPVPPRHKPYPPGSIPDPMPGVDPQQTPGIDRSPAEWRQEA